MPTYPALNGRQIVQVLQSLGFYVDRVSGSHHMLEKAGHPVTVPVPVHGSRIVPRSTFRTILKLAGLSRESFYEAYRRL